MPSDRVAIPRGLHPTPGLCNGQCDISGPFGRAVFFCTNAEMCDGIPHQVTLKSEPLWVNVAWSLADACGNGRDDERVVDLVDA